ncbi:helix-turn-helix transcriptional regulator (plasmid) [Pontibacillus sp. ALD_SL1]|uniref:helix-turn-helix domain-containing protein n=1 Tax=Pontibacillus sp. ALD_SL1 TaxID=2777185 RepID=UPI001A96ED17|nr:helix-turn-helix domain-containing protein [Pontibacillus sp. ALD_SL1]QST02282.1 helix-turn-helix transcriptional regulator [Pontibacillus sp. ALD_SL1]
MNYAKVGPVIREKRKERGYTIEELASKVGVSRGYLANFETLKTKTIDMDVLVKLNACLGGLVAAEMQEKDNHETLASYLDEQYIVIQELIEEDPDQARRVITIINNVLQAIKK